MVSKYRSCIGKCNTCGNKIYVVTREKYIGHDQNCTNYGTRKLN
jgi:hypothetical protein